MGRRFNIVTRTKARIRIATYRIKRVVKFLTVDIWSLNINDLSRWKARLIKDTKTIIVTLNTFSEQKMGFQITALAYQCMMSVVPALAIAFFLTSGVGLSDKLEEFLYANVSNEGLIASLMNAADNIISTAQSGFFGFASMATFLWIVIWMMISVTRVFNNAWKVTKQRNFFRQLGAVILILILSPFVLLLFFSGSIVYTHVLDLVVPNVAFSEHIKSFLAWVVFAAAAVMIISLMYKYIPACRVHYRHALKAAIISGLAFTLLQYLYLETQVMVTKQSAVYGVLAGIPLFMIWLNFSWSIIIYGAELSYGFQTVEQMKITTEQLDEEITTARNEKRNKRQMIKVRK